MPLRLPSCGREQEETEKHRLSGSPWQDPTSCGRALCPHGEGAFEDHANSQPLEKPASLMHRVVTERSGGSRNHTTRPAICEPCLERLRKEILDLEYPCPGIPPGLLGPQHYIETASVYPEAPGPEAGPPPASGFSAQTLGSRSSCPSCPLALPSLSFYTCIAASPNLPTRWVRHISPESLAKWKQPALRKEGRKDLLGGSSCGFCGQAQGDPPVPRSSGTRRHSAVGSRTHSP